MIAAALLPVIMLSAFTIGITVGTQHIAKFAGVALPARNSHSRWVACAVLAAALILWWLL